MDQDSRCQLCHAPLTGQAVGELCAKCLLGLALEPAGGDFPTVSLAPELTAPIGESGGSAERTRVRYFGDYELVEEIARGGMGVVYKARQVSLNRIVALKMILAGDFSPPALIERFQTEAEAAARLEHSNIVPIYEIGIHEGLHYFSMRFVEGGTLTQALGRDKFTPRRAAELMVKVARAVHHAHQRGIIHRDLKPGNILLDAVGEPHVADFGLAKLLEHDSALTQSATILGTPSYMAPEQAEGQMKEATTAVDIYSLGAILYELLTGRPPFVGRSPLEVLVQVREREPASPQSLKPELDRDVAVICLKCLEKDPARRYGSAEALAEELQRWLLDEPIQARHVTAGERVVKWARRKPVVAGLVVALHLVSIAGLVGILWQSDRAKKEAVRATSEAECSQVEAGKARAESRRAESELWNANYSEARALRIAGGSGARVQSAGLVQKLLQRPDLTAKQILQLREEAIAQMALVDVMGPTNDVGVQSGRWFVWDSRLNRYVRDAESNRVEVREYPSSRVLATFSGPPKSTVDQVVFSPDDQFLAARFSKAAGEVRVWKLGTPEPILRTVCEPLGGTDRIYISPDNRTLAMLTTNGVAVQPIAADSARRFLQPGRLVHRLAYSADSKHLAVLSAAPPNFVEIWDAESGVMRVSFEVDFPPERLAWHPDGTRLVMGGDRGRLELRNLAKEDSGIFRVSEPFPLRGHLGSIQHVGFDPDGSALLTSSWDLSSMVWDLVSGHSLLREQRLLFTGSQTTAGQISARHGERMTVASLIDRTGYRTVAWAGAARNSLGVWMSPDGRFGVVNYDSTFAQTEGDCLVWDFARGMEIARLKGCWAQFSADSRMLFLFERYAENQVRRYDVSAETLANPPASWKEGTIVYRGGPTEMVNTGIMHPDGRTLVIAATDAVIHLDTLGQRPIRSWKMPAYFVTLSNDGEWMATERDRAPTVLRSAHTGERLLDLPRYSRALFSPDNRWLGLITPTNVQLHQFGLPLRPAYAAIALHADASLIPPLAFSPDSRVFAVGCYRTRVCLYETSTGRELATFTPPDPAPIIGPNALTFSPDGQWLLAAKDDGETVAWNLPVIRTELAKLRLNWEDRQK